MTIFTLDIIKKKNTYRNRPIGNNSYLFSLLVIQYSKNTIATVVIKRPPAMGALSPESIDGSPVIMYIYVRDVDAIFNQAVSASARAEPSERPFRTLKDPFRHS